VDDLVAFTGRIDGASPLIANHRLYAHASRYESQGITLLEALSYGRPLLAAPVGGIPEVFTDGVEGRFIDLEDPGAAARALVSVLESDELYAQMSAAALNRYRRAFAREVVAPKWFRFFEGVVEEAATRSAQGKDGGAGRAGIAACSAGES
jgi:glycosyltransferase involved in cell wall biosynthesis